MFFKKKKVNPLFDLRHQLLNNEVQIDETVGVDQVTAVIIDIGSKKGGYSLVAVADGSCSLYFEKGGGIIGAGEHKNVRYVSNILLNKANDYIYSETSFTQVDFSLPKDKIFVAYILTKKGNFKLVGSTDNLSESSKSVEAFMLGNSVITQLRMLHESDYKTIGDDEILINFIKENNYDAFVIALEDLNNPNAVDGSKSALMTATYVRNKEIVKELINKGACLNFKDETGMNSLMVASYLGIVDLIDELTSIDTINSRDNAGYTSLMFACNAGKMSCVKKLIDMNADINIEDNESSTALMFAAQHGYDLIVKYLLDNDADKNIVGKHGLRAVDFAIQNKHSSTIEILKTY